MNKSWFIVLYISSGLLDHLQLHSRVLANKSNSKKPKKLKTQISTSTAMAVIGGRAPFFEAQDFNGIDEELTKTFKASRDLVKLSKESFNDLFENLTKNDHECQDFVGGMITGVVGGISEKAVRRIIRGIFIKQEILGHNGHEWKDVVVTAVKCPNPNAKFIFTMNFKSVQAASVFQRSSRNILTTLANSKTDKIRGFINGILVNIVADVVELGKEFDG